ncbi:PP2C family protein-serine/threonine phosphatase [Streptomyces sp. JL3001]|uniref:PP2C family protein-serine/threonine phosphatase n=1 Tax=Streptomyces sp. JL3001 TaxID=3400923 RepID=UPI003B27F905
MRRFVRLLPALLIALGAAYDYATPLDFTGAPFLTAAPLVAAPLYSQRGTILTGVAAVVVLLVLRVARGGLHKAEAVTELVTVVVVSVLAVLVNLLVRRGQERLASVREIAEAAQRAVLPEPDERIGGFQIAARYEAAQEGASIGGDLYAVQDTPHGVRLIVGDVRGKGMGAVGAVAVVIGAFREAAEQEATLEAVAQRLERALARERTRREGIEAREGFTTVVLAELPRGGPRGTYRGAVRTGCVARCAFGGGATALRWRDGGRHGAHRRASTLTVVTRGDRTTALRITTDIPSIPMWSLRFGQLARFRPLVTRKSGRKSLMIKRNSLESAPRVY